MIIELATIFGTVTYKDIKAECTIDNGYVQYLNGTVNNIDRIQYIRRYNGDVIISIDVPTNRYDYYNQMLKECIELLETKEWQTKTISKQ